jgi:hypothetical protein
MDHLDPLPSPPPVVGRFLLPVFRMGLRLPLEAAVAAGYLPVIIPKRRARIEQIAFGLDVAFFLGDPGQGIERQAQTQG